MQEESTVVVPRAFRRRRMQFRAWLAHELRARGERLTERPSYESLQEALRRQLRPVRK